MVLKRVWFSREPLSYLPFQLQMKRKPEVKQVIRYRRSENVWKILSVKGQIPKVHLQKLLKTSDLVTKGQIVTLLPVQISTCYYLSKLHGTFNYESDFPDGMNSFSL